MIIGHQKIIDYFQCCLGKNHLGHAYFFSGPESIGKRTLAENLIQRLECAESKKLGEACHCRTCREISQKTFPDFYYLTPREDKKEINIEQTRDLINRLSKSPYQGKYQSVIVDGVELLNVEAANALLKTLEEPSANTKVFLISHQPQLVLPTLKSRCQEIAFVPVGTCEIENYLKIVYNKAKPNEIKLASRLACGRPGLAINYLDGSAGKNFLAAPTVVAELDNLTKIDLSQRFAFVKNNLEKLDWQIKLNQWLLIARDSLLAKVKTDNLSIYGAIPSIWQKVSADNLLNKIQVIEKTQTILQQSGLNHRLALEILMLEL